MASHCLAVHEKCISVAPEENVVQTRGGCQRDPVT